MSGPGARAVFGFAYNEFMGNEQDIGFLRQAIEKSRQSLQEGNFPAGAVVVKDGKVISKGVSLGHKLHDPTEHAETSAIKKACQAVGSSNLEGATLYESLECCNMCFSVCNWVNISKIVYACRKTPGCKSPVGYE